MGSRVDEAMRKLKQQTLEQHWEEYEKYREELGYSPPNTVIWYSCDRDRVYEVIANGRGKATALVRNDGNPTDALVYYEKEHDTEDAAIADIEKQVSKGGDLDSEDEYDDYGDVGESEPGEG